MKRLGHQARYGGALAVMAGLLMTACSGATTPPATQTSAPAPVQVPTLALS
jgi:hypothetical protein